MTVELIGTDKAEALKIMGALVRNGEYCAYGNNPSEVKDDVILMRTFGAASVGLPDLIYPIVVDDMCPTCVGSMNIIATLLHKVLVQTILRGAEWDPARRDNSVAMLAMLGDLRVDLRVDEVPSSALLDERWADQQVFEMAEGVYTRANVKDPMVCRFAQLTVADFNGRYPTDSGYVGLSFIGPVAIKPPGVNLCKTKTSIQ